MSSQEVRRYSINEQIKSLTVRLIGADGEQLGILPLEEAQSRARDAELDLVELAPDADPSVCKLMDYSRHLFEARKRRAAARRNHHRTQVKEIKFRPGTEEADYQVKLRSLIRFLNQGDKAKVTVRFRGREMAHQEIGVGLIERVSGDLEDYGSIEQEAKMEGRQLTMVLAPRGKGKKRRGQHPEQSARQDGSEQGDGGKTEST